MIDMFIRFGNSLENHTRFQTKMDKVYGEFFTWRDGGHSGVPKQWNSGHVGVPNKSCGNWSLFLCKRFCLFQWICIEAGHVSENTPCPFSDQNDTKTIPSGTAHTGFSLCKGVPTWSGSHDISRLISIKGLFERIWKENQYLILIICMECL